MPGMQFEFDETGGSFYYFLVSFYLLILVPLTYFFWPKNDNKDLLDQSKRKCRCDQCQSKSNILTASSPNKRRRKKLQQVVFIVAWILFFLLAYKVSQIEMEWKEFDPFAELDISKDATSLEIRKAYKQLSLKYHPDKGGDPKRFIRLTKAYAALTNEQSRKNFQEYGNPDGPGATQFGIALPKWIVDKKNSVFVLGAYVLVFMILLPITVGLWWYRRIKFNGDKILLNTSQLYFYFFNRTPNMPLKRVIMILSSSMEFNKANNSEIIERPSDNEEVPIVLKHFPQINIKIKEMPFAAVYSVKTRVLIYSHLHRFPLTMNTLNQDKVIVIKKCPFLINEMINIIAQLVAYGHHDKSVNTPRLETIEYCMKLSQIVIQALSENQSPMMQLPHVTEEILRHFVTRKRNVRSIRQLVEMKEDDRRNLLRSFSDDQYRDLIHVCSNMPLITMECNCEVMDEEDPSITPSSIVTVTVSLIRKSMGSLFPQGVSTINNKWNNSNMLRSFDNQNDGTLYSGMTTSSEVYNVDNNNAEEDEASEVENSVINSACNMDLEQAQEHSSPKKKPVWEKNRKKKGNVPKNNKSKVKKNKQVVTSKQNGKIATQIAVIEDKPIKQLNGHDENSDEAESVVGVVENEETNDVENSQDKFEDDKWKRFQEEARKENSLETKERTTHQVHCPYFPTEKYEWWWVYLADKKNHKLITAPLQLCSLQDNEDIQLKFTAPDKPGHYVYNVCLKSDSYLDFDQSEQIKITVKEAKKYDYDKQWNISDEENSGGSDESDSESVHTSMVRKKTKSHASVEEEELSCDTDYDYDD